MSISSDSKAGRDGVSIVAQGFVVLDQSSPVFTRFRKNASQALMHGGTPWKERNDFTIVVDGVLKIAALFGIRSGPLVVVEYGSMQTDGFVVLL